MTSKILIVDDEEHIRLLYRTELEAAGFEVDELSSGVELLETLAVAEPDLMVLDIRMPGPSGLDLLNSIRSEHRDLPIVLSSAYSSFHGDMRTLPADAYVIKSSDVGPLIGTVRSLLEERQASRAAETEPDPAAPATEPSDPTPTKKTRTPRPAR